MTMRLKPGARVTGVVRDDRRHPVAGVSVYVQGQPAIVQTGVTDESGAFSFDGLSRSSYRLIAAGGQLFSSDPITVDASGGDVRQDLVIRRTPVFEGKVIDASGAPI